MCSVAPEAPPYQKTAMRIIVALSVWALGACTPAVHDKPAAASPAATVEVTEPAPTVERTPTPDDATHDEVAVPTDGSWYTPRPPLTLRLLTAAQKAQVKACLDDNRVKEADVRAEELAAAAACLAAVPMVGHEIRMYRELLSRHPVAPEAMMAMRQLGMRYEQIDVRDQAVEFYSGYLRRYPKQPDARELGQRAVCLAHSLGIAAKVKGLLDQLERLYARRGFERPDPHQLSELCAAVPQPAAPPSEVVAVPAPTATAAAPTATRGGIRTPSSAPAPGLSSRRTGQMGSLVPPMTSPRRTRERALAKRPGYSACAGFATFQTPPSGA